MSGQPSRAILRRDLRSIWVTPRRRFGVPGHVGETPKARSAADGSLRLGATNEMKAGRRQEPSSERRSDDALVAEYEA